MATQADVATYRGVMSKLSLAATADGKALLSEVAQASPVATREALQDALPTVLQPYMTASAEYAAVWYEDLRRSALGGSYAAEMVDAVPDSLANGIARYAVKPLLFESNSTALALLASGLQKAIANAGRDTIARNVRSDSSGVAYARTPAAGCCAFCAMLASRGAVYGSARAAGGVVGRGIERGVYTDKLGRDIVRGGGVKALGTQAIGAKYHGFCRCVATPVWPGDSLPYDQTKYEAMYDAMYKPGVGYDLSHVREKYGIK